jgi:hypothetical protein
MYTFLLVLFYSTLEFVEPNIINAWDKEGENTGSFPTF